MVDYPEVIPPIAMLSVTVRSIELHTIRRKIWIIKRLRVVS